MTVSSLSYAVQSLGKIETDADVLEKAISKNLNETDWVWIPLEYFLVTFMQTFITA